MTTHARTISTVTSSGTPGAACTVGTRGQGLGLTGIAPELPAGRTLTWNLALLALEAAGAAWMHATGISWPDVALTLGAALAAVTAMVAVVAALATSTSARDAAAASSGQVAGHNSGHSAGQSAAGAARRQTREAALVQAYARKRTARITHGHALWHGQSGSAPSTTTTTTSTTSTTSAAAATGGTR